MQAGLANGDGSIILRTVIALFSCVQAVEKGLIKEVSVRLDSCFIKGDFTRWRKATEKFKEHGYAQLRHKKRLTHLALMHVHSDVMDSLDIGSLMRSFISANPERKATFGVA
ncbi:zinc finger MYM-type 1-like protein [Xyrichtys novacula]|uniref:Zinc finger MYM-type 1-like protein n=1 Tax=Xyrichtys novacula TaxID=13765 RepID=A0AAV1F870_XYRNO|nr:zinc finger MYM-type 1-like protein [Xyrichtys novacula]